MKNTLNYLPCIIFDVPMWAFTLLLCLLVWTKPQAQSGCLVCEIKPRWYTNWWLKRFSGGCLGHSIIYGPGALETIAIDSGLEKHEHTHKRQYRMAMWAGMVNGILVSSVTGNYILGLVIWFISAALMYVCGGLSSVLSGGGFYEGNNMETSARAETKVWLSNG